MDLVTYIQAFVSPFIRRVVRNERGASLVEYALLVALIAVVCIVALKFIGGATKDTLNEAGSQLNGA